MTIKLGKYQHYKGNYYEVIHTGWHSDTMENYVVYRALYDSDKLGKKPIFVKHSDEFCKNVIVDGKEIPRFKKVEDKHFDDKKAEQLISFIKEIEKLKHVTRVILTSDLERYENTAEHSWHMAMMLLVLQEHFPHADMEKMMKMALVHDLVEIYTGDIPSYDVEGRIGKEEKEQEAAKKLFSKLPSELGQEFHDLFNEFEEEETKEAKIVRSCDKIQAMLQNILSGGRAFKKAKLSIDWIENYGREQVSHSEIFTNLFEKLMAEIKANNLAWKE